MAKKEREFRPANEDKHYLWIIILFLIVVGSGVIYLVFGWQSLILAIPVLILGAILLLLPFYLIQFLGWLANKYKDRHS